MDANNIAFQLIVIVPAEVVTMSINFKQGFNNTFNLFCVLYNV